MKGAFKVTDKLEQWMKLKGWNQRQLAKELDYDEAAIARWLPKKKEDEEKTKIPEHPSWQMLRKLCILTGLDIGDLLTFDKDIEQED